MSTTDYSKCRGRHKPRPIIRCRTYPPAPLRHGTLDCIAPRPSIRRPKTAATRGERIVCLIFKAFLRSSRVGRVLSAAVSRDRTHLSTLSHGEGSEKSENLSPFPRRERGQRVRFECERRQIRTVPTVPHSGLGTLRRGSARAAARNPNSRSAFRHARNFLAGIQAGQRGYQAGMDSR
jgi:hypothetical protein